MYQPIHAQTLEDMLEKAQEDIDSARESGIIGTVSILSNSSHTDSKGILHVVREVYNDDMVPMAAIDVQVIATFYDSSGKVVGTGKTFTNPRDIESGKRAPFDLVLPPDMLSVQEVDRYELQVNWK